MSSFRFRATRRGDRVTGRKKIRNRVYIACGIAMVACMVLIALYQWLWQKTFISEYQPVFILECTMVWAFGISWMIKGETLGKDKKPSRAN